ncbi:type I HSP40 co-chaperone [Martiniozyma asiatica (nom. inval.)]|nr:type I HSP40 co-chaperone [Martiniozyma asiatica]
MSEYTPEQEKVVLEILKIEHSDYYKVLKSDKNSTDVEIKKSYRKLAIKLHPDKNKHPKASEAFKRIAKAFEVLSDEGKRKLYDMTGRDPDSRGGGGGGSGAAGGGFEGFARNGFGGAQFGGAHGAGGVEDILNAMFGMNGMGGAQFQQFHFGGPGMGMGGNGFPNGFFFSPGGAGMGMRGGMPRTQRTNNARRQQGNNARNPQIPNWYNYLIQYLPIIILLFSMLSSFWGGSGDSNSKKFSGKVPRYTFSKNEPFVVERNTPIYHIPYFITERTSNDFQLRKQSNKEFIGLDKYVEKKYVDDLERGCYIERKKKEAMLEDGYGLFFNDWELINKAKAMPMPNCQKWNELKLL